MTHTGPHNPPRRAAFTMIELICVVLVLSVTAGLIVPRVVGNEARAQETKARAIADLFSAIARKDALSDEPLRLQFDREKQTLEFLVLRRDSLQTSFNNAGWVKDPLAADIPLDDITPGTLSLDGVSQFPDNWTIEFPQTATRQPVHLTLDAINESGKPVPAWVVELLPYETKATIRRAGAASDPLRNRLVDLDAVGRGESPW